MKRLHILTFIVTGLVVFAAVHSCKKKKDDPAPPGPGNAVFYNPLQNGSDPWIIKKDSFYYYTQTLGNRIAIWKTKSVSRLATATSVTAFTPTAGSPNAANIWAPEIHFIQNKWYIYYTAGNGTDVSQRTWVLENGNSDPTTGSWTDKGRIYTPDTDFWAIDGSVMMLNGESYFLWSGRPDPAQQKQNLYIAKMTNPWTLQAPAVMISQPELTWETQGGPVNEGPQFLSHGGKYFIVYSASGCWTDDYALGMLTLKAGGNPLVAADWTKTQHPVFSKNPGNKAFAPGHNAFFTSADGTEDWIIYHANTNTGQGCGVARNIRIQKFSWKADGTPDFGTPVSISTPFSLPSGE